jgi:two-component system chemotaxis response regulator CheB
MAKKDIIVIGGSTGSGAVLKRLLSELPPDLEASLFIATHMPSGSSGYLADMLDKTSALPIAQAMDGQPIEEGRIYVAAPDRHLLIDDGTLRLGDGPRENMTRPSIDSLFRSAALSYGSRAVGVILTGLLNDGASGLFTIKQAGGTAIVQHPLDAEADQMPLAALDAVDADVVATEADLAAVLAEISRTDAGPSPEPPPGLELEVDIAAGSRLDAEKLRKIADPSALSCSDCQGVLSDNREQRPLCYRCQMGQAQTAEVLASCRAEVDEALRIALRVMEERVTLVTRMAKDARNVGRNAVAELYEARAEEFTRYATILREAAVRSHRLSRRQDRQNL